MSTPYRLRTAVWEITLACPFSCRYCGSRAGRARENELTTDECLDVCRQLGEMGLRRVSLIGGEVFLRRDWAQIVSALTAQGIRVNVITNGYLFTPELLDILKSAAVESVSVSLDGPRDIHDRGRQTGSYDRAVAAIRALAGAGIPVSVITTLSRESAAALEELYAALRALPLCAWQIQACSPMGNAADGGLDFRFSFADVIRFVETHREEAPFPLGIADNIGYYTPEEGALRGAPGAPFTGCRAGLTSVGIDSVGNVRGCESLYDERFIEGNLRERSLREIWEDPDAFSYNRRFTPDLLTGACAECPHAARCAGGCRSYNAFAGGTLYESPACARITR